MAALTHVESVAELLIAIEKSSLLSAESLAKARETAAALTDPKTVARALIKDGTLTRWQADQLLHGYHRLIIGKYKLLNQIEVSPTGRVYLAEHMQMGRRHALKVLAKRLATNPDAVARFLKSAQNACGLDHKNINHVYDVSQDRLGHFVVMEYVEGQSLEQLVEKSGPLKLPQVLDYIWQVADGLAYAHSHGVVHGDLKPANLVRDNNGVIKILEIGQDSAGARPETEDADEDVEIAALAAVIFQAPEMRGDGDAADIACDVYSLGSVLSFLLTGKVGKNAQAAAANLQVNQEIPATLVDLCRNLMADNPKERPHSVDAVIGSIHSIATQVAEGNQLPISDAPDGGKKKRNNKETLEKSVIAPPVAVAVNAGMPVIALEETSPPVVSPPPVEIAIQTHGRSERNPKGSGALNSRSAAPWSVPFFVNRPSPLVLAGAIGGAAVFAFGLGTIVLLMVAATRTAKLEAKANGDRTKAAHAASVEGPAANESNPVAVPVNPQSSAAAAVPVVADENSPPGVPSPAESNPPPSLPAATAPVASAPASSVPSAEPIVPKPTAQPLDSPAAIVASANSRPATPPGGQAKKSSDDPFSGFAKAISLPPLPEQDSPDVASQKPVRVAACAADADMPVMIALLGGDTAIRATRQRFELQPREMSSREWEIQLTGGSETVTVALLAIKNGELQFQWTDGGGKQSPIARHLMNCALVLGKSKQTVALRTAQKGQPLVIDIEKPSASVKWILNNLPQAKQIFFEVTRTEGFPKLRQEPRGLMNVGDTLTIGTGPAEKSIPLFFKLNTSSATASIDVRSQPAVKIETAGEPQPYRRKDLLALQIQHQQRLGLLLGELKKWKDSRPRADAEKEAREATIIRLANEETALNIVLDQLRFILDFAGATEGAAKVHFRVYFLAGDAKIDLLKTEDDEDAK